MLGRYLLFLFFLVSIRPTFAATELAVSPAGKEKAEHIITLKRAGDLFFIEAKVDGSFGNFILDTGCEELVLNEVYFRPDSIDHSRMSASLNSASSSVAMVAIRQMQIADMDFTELLADVTDLSAIENQKGLKIFGLINLTFFQGFIYELDFNNNLLTLRDKKVNIPKEEALLEIPIKIFDGITTLSVQVNKVKLRFSLDTGAELNVLHNGLSTDVYAGMSILRTSDLLAADGSRNQVLLAKIKNLSIEGESYDEMLTFVLDLVHLRSVHGEQIDGSLGYPFFSQGRFIIDHGHKRLYVFPISKSK